MIEVITRYRAAAPRRVIGLMSGTSADAVDSVLVELAGAGHGTEWEIVLHSQHPLPPRLREAILAASRGAALDELLGSRTPAAGIALLDTWIAETLASAAQACMEAAGIGRHKINLIASHGQTVCHLPSPKFVNGTELRATLQLGSGAVIAAATGVPVMNNFRQADMALGGQGAPLVPYADWVLFSQPERTRAIQNLGGIGNVTYLPGSLDGIIAFDTGPGNMILDAAVRQITGGARHFDEGGRLAARGQVSLPLLGKLLEHPFLEKSPPRSTGHEDFGEAYWLQVHAWAKDLAVGDSDLLKTLTAATAESAVSSYRRFLPRFPDEIILGGGGSLNPVMVEQFRRLSHPTPVRTHEEFGIDAQAKEALAFAILANESMLGNPSNIPAATGASGHAVLGCLHLPPPRGGENQTSAVEKSGKAV